MKLKNIIQIGSFGFAVALSSTAQSQTYMCQACPAGTYSNGSSTSCTPCPAGKYSYTASSSCSTCRAGTYSAAGSGTCTPCPAGQYNNTDGATSCQKCPAGTYANSTGSTSCTPCPDYHWSNAGASQCGRIKLRFWLWKWRSNGNNSEKVPHWFYGEERLLCDPDVYGKNPAPRTEKFCGNVNIHIVSQDDSVSSLPMLNCRKLPCTVYGTSSTNKQRYIRFNPDGTSSWHFENQSGESTANLGDVIW